MPRIPAVSRIDAEPEARGGVAEVLALLATGSGVRLVSEDGAECTLPPQMTVLLRRAGEILGQGHAVDVLDASSDSLTPNEAADLIGISRPTLLKLIDEGVLTATHVPGSSHRRLDRVEVENFRDQRLQMQAALASAADDARDSGLFARRPRQVRIRSSRR